MRQVLFISYYFPPSGGPGVQRTLKFVKYLPEFGWQPTVLTVDPAYAAYPEQDADLMSEVPTDTRVVRTRSWDPYASYARFLGRPKEEAVGVAFVDDESESARQKFALWLRANLFLPDARVGWMFVAIREARKLCEESNFDAVITTGPPHSTHLVGNSISKRFNIPWLADFRDPWTGIHYYADLPATTPARALDRKLESKVLGHAKAVTVVSPTMATNLAKILDREYLLIPNGFDPADFKNEAAVPSGRFVLRYTGTLSRTQNPVGLWQALSSLRGEDDLNDVSVELVGNVDRSVLESILQLGIDDLVSTHAYLPHREVVALMKESSLLLLVINDVPNASEILTGKLFEYLASGRPILGVGPVSGDAAQILDETGAGTMFEHDDVSGLADHIRSHLVAHKKGQPVAGAAPEKTDRYSRRSLTGYLAATLNSICEG